jgi:hypothetical protein
MMEFESWQESLSAIGEMIPPAMLVVFSIAEPTMGRR